MSELETASFDAVIDKGLTDAVMHNDNFAVMVGKVGGTCTAITSETGISWVYLPRSRNRCHKQGELCRAYRSRAQRQPCSPCGQQSWW